MFAVTQGMERRERLTTIVADVQTDLNTNQVLEEGTGELRALVGAFSDDQGRVHLARGLTLSYYEFKQPLAERLTDEAWRVLLAQKPPAEPAWIASFTAKSSPTAIQPSPPAASAPSPTPSLPASSGPVIGNRNSHIYHDPACSSVGQMSAKNKVLFASAAAAQAAGYRACQRCGG